MVNIVFVEAGSTIVAYVCVGLQNLEDVTDTQRANGNTCWVMGWKYNGTPSYSDIQAAAARHGLARPSQVIWRVLAPKR